MAPPNEASCWLCLEEGPDIFGKPLVRNCSCRGCSGFAHISCLITYAESFSKKALQSDDEDDVSESISSFTICPNCRQDYQNNVAYELSAAAVKFVEREFASDQHLQHVYIDALMSRMTQLKVEIANDRHEGEAIVIKILDALDKLKHADTGHHLLSSDEGHAHANIATFFHQIGSNDSLQKAKFHFQIARSIFEKERDDLSIMMIDKLLDHIEAKNCGEEMHHQCQSHVSDVELCAKAYALYTKEFSKEDDMTIAVGTKFAVELWRASKTIEAKRLLVELVETSRRVHGSEHECTRCATLALQQMNYRLGECFS